MIPAPGDAATPLFPRLTPLAWLAPPNEVRINAGSRSGLGRDAASSDGEQGA